MTLPVKLGKAGLYTCFHGWFVVQLRAPVGLQPITRHSDLCRCGYMCQFLFCTSDKSES